jgi:hypothetical protein
MVSLGKISSMALTPQLPGKPGAQQCGEQADYRAEHGEPNGYFSGESSVCFHEPWSLSFMLET